MIARICERWTMDLLEPEVGTDEWFMNWVLRSPRQAGHHLTAGFHAYSSLLDVYQPEDISSVREYFGGMGAQSCMIQDLFHPDYHVILDYAREAAEYIAKAVPEARVYQADSYRSEWTQPVDLVGLDFGDLTAWKTREGEKHCDLLDRVFLLEPKAVVFTDIACRYLHLHRDRYETLLGPGTCTSYETYLDALLLRFQRLWGYTLVAGYWDRWSTVMALVPYGTAPRGIIQPTPSSPVGLEIF